MPLDWGPMGKEKRETNAQYELDKQKRRKRRRGVEAVVSLVQARGLDGAVHEVASRCELEIPHHIPRAVAFMASQYDATDPQFAAQIRELSMQFGLQPPAPESGEQGLAVFRARLRLHVIEVLVDLAAAGLALRPR